MRKLAGLSIIFFTLFTIVISQAQQTGWCGYALLEGLPLLSNQLSPFEAITPDRSSTVNPAALFQYRFSLDHSKVIIEGCWKTNLTRDLAVSLLANVIPASPYLIQYVQQQNLSSAPITDALAPTPTALSGADAVRAYIDMNLTLTIFAPGGTDADSAAQVRDYLQQDAKEWEPPDDS